MQSPFLLRHLIASLLIDRHQLENAIQDTCLSVVQQEKASYSDSFTQFVEALYEEFDFDKAFELIPKMKSEAESDILLRNHSAEIQRQAYILLFETKCKIYKTINLE